MISSQRNIWMAAAVATAVATPQPASAVDGVSVTTHFEGDVTWTIGGFGSIWRHDIVNSQVVARRKLHDGPGRMVVMSPDARKVAFIMQTSGAVTVLPIGGGIAQEVATAHPDATLDWPADDWVYYNRGGWSSEEGSRRLFKVDASTGVSQPVVVWDYSIWRFHVANDETRAVVRPTDGGGGIDGTILTYELPGTGAFRSANATDEPSCGSAIDPQGAYFVDGKNEHQGFDIREWTTLDIVQSFDHDDAVAWGGPDSGLNHNRNGWSVNSQDWICGHIGWEISPYLSHPNGGTGGNQVLYSWKQGSEDRIVVTPNQEGSYAYDSAGDFWVGPPPVPASTGLRAYWQFEDGLLAADAVGPHTLVNGGAVAGTGRIHAAAEFVAAEFDRLSIPDASLADGVPFKLENGRPEFTVAGWFRKNRLGASEYLLQKGRFSFGLLIKPGSGGGQDDFCVELARYPRNSSAPAATHLCWADSIAPNSWTFFAVTLSASRTLRVRLWDNTGAWLSPDQTWELSEPPIFTDGDLVIGCGEWNGQDQCFDGLLDELQLYDQSLSPQEIEDLVTPPDCTAQGYVCCAAGSICSQIEVGSGCRAGEICCASPTACAPQSCGDGFCSVGETCEEDSCCNGRRVDGVTSICCSNVFVQGECCDTSDCAALQVCMAHQCTAPLMAPGALWSMNAGGLTWDSLGQNTLTNDGATEGAGKCGGGAALGGGSMLRITDADLAPGMPLASHSGVAELTVTGWFYRERTDSFDYLMQKGAYTEEKLSLGIYTNDSGQLCVEIGEPPGASTEDFCSRRTLPPRIWHFFAVSLTSGGQVRIAVWNGHSAEWLPERIGALQNPIHLDDGELHLGHGEWDGDDHWFVGALDEIRIYDQVLTPDQLEAVRARDASGGNLPPVVDAGTDQTGITESTILGVDASVSDPNNDILSLSWTLLSGPADVSIAAPVDLVTAVSFISPGEYTFELVANDGEMQGTDTTTVTVVPPASIDLTRPLGGEVFNVGDVEFIEWTAIGILDVAIHYSTDNGDTWDVVATSVDTSEEEWGSFPWTVPDEPSTDCLIRLSGYFDSSNASVSPSAFEIRRSEQPDPPDPVDTSSTSSEPEGEGCQCRSAGGAPSLLVVGACLLLTLRRRRWVE